MSFADDLARHRARTAERVQRVVVRAASDVLASVQVGSSVTGAPGQPVDTGALRASWQLTWPAPAQALISTHLVYARGIEDGIDARTGRSLTLRSTVGGFHSVAKTLAGFPRLVAAIVGRGR